MAADQDLIWLRVHWPQPLDHTQAVAFLRRLAADRSAPCLVWETRADSEGVRYLLGVPPAHTTAVTRTLRHLVDGTTVTTESGQYLPVRASGRLRLRNHEHVLNTDAAEDTIRAVLAALAAPLGSGETLVIQVILGPRSAPRLVGKPWSPPQPGLLQLLAPSTASPDAHAGIQAKAGRHGFSAIVRIGVAAATPEKRRQRVVGLLSALATAESPGQRLSLVREDPDRLDYAHQPWRWPLRLLPEELVMWLGWPIGDGDLPGLPAQHPRPLRAAREVHTADRVFAQATAPGDARCLGVAAKDSLRHLVALGPTGSGKSTALLNLICADIEAGRSVVVVDPKRQLIDDVCARIPAHRHDDVVLLDATDDPVVGFNPLAAATRPETVVDGILAVCAAIFHDGWGPRTQDLLHAGLLTLARTHDIERPAVLTDLPRLFTDPSFRRPLVGQVMDEPALGPFWAWYEGLAPPAQAQVLAAPMNKLRQFLLRPQLRAILGQARPRITMEQVFAEHKILLVPLNEGLLGPQTAALLGSLVVAELWQATLRRAALPDPAGDPAMVYVDEVQQYLHLPLSIADALAQSRSLGVGWHVAHQFRDQLPPTMRAAIDANARSKICFGLEVDDARDMARMAPGLTAEDFMSLRSFEVYANLVADGRPSGWASARTLPPPEPCADPAVIRRISRERYGGPVAPVTALPPATERQAESATPPQARLEPGDRVGRRRRQS